MRASPDDRSPGRRPSHRRRHGTKEGNGGDGPPPQAAERPPRLLPTLPEHVDPHRIEALLRSGLLHLRVPERAQMIELEMG
jgi:hypothetical protein